MRAAVKIKKAVGAVAMVAAILAAIAFAATTVINRKQNKPTFVFGYSIMRVETGSMEPTIPAKSYVIVKKSDGVGLKEGTTITFVCSDETSSVYGRLVTHRIVEITDDGYRTKGDAAAIDDWTVSPKDVVATYERNVPFLGVIGRIFSSWIGLAAIAVLFVGSCAFVYIPEMIDAVKDDEKTKKEKEIDRRVKEEVEKLRARESAERRSDE